MAADLTQACLLDRRGPERDFPIPEGPEVLVGQDKDSGVRVPFPGVSRHHAKITFDGKGYWIEDAGSANGTFLNGRRVIKRERLDHLDVVSLGRSTELIFVRRRTDTTRVLRYGIRNAWLEILDGLEAGASREIPRGTMTIGRSSSNNLVADSQLVSKIHVRLERNAVELLLVDLQSSNGTWMEGEKIETSALEDGDEFSLAGVRGYRVHIESGDVETSGPGRKIRTMASIVQPLPTDWKTRIEWSPEEIEAMDAQVTRFKSAAQPPKTSAAAAPPLKRESPFPSRKPAAAEESPRSQEPTPSAVSGATPRPPQPASTAPEAATTARPEPPGPLEAVKRPPPAAQSPASPAGQQQAEVSPEPNFRVQLEGWQEPFLLPAGVHIIGRAGDASVHLDNHQISRRHAIIRVSTAGATVEDLGSSNGTYVNRERITAPRALAPGDLLQLGEIRLTVRFIAEKGPGAKP
jgi:pSer/pThr/pTyr-binding forkhead associated (FHA) protein